MTVVGDAVSHALTQTAPVYFPCFALAELGCVSGTFRELQQDSTPIPLVGFARPSSRGMGGERIVNTRASALLGMSP